VSLTTHRERFRNATDTVELTSPLGDQPKARVSYAGIWYDGVGRPTATANYGTNGDGTPPTRPGSPPESSDTVLVTTTLYNAAGIDKDSGSPRRTRTKPSRVVKRTLGWRATRPPRPQRGCTGHKRRPGGVQPLRG